ncbi:MAG: DUF2304 domain-containing protein [Chloroflexi bacterium]|nr:DUF2304 domain-containing protein [Chloroflexota bacterium]
MNPTIQIIAIIGSLAIMLVVAWLIRRRALREEYALLWFAASIGLIAVSLWRRSLDIAARLVGVAYPPSVLLLAGIILGFFLALHYSVSLSRLTDQNKRLAQEIALLRYEIERRDARLLHDPPARDGAGADG